MQRPGLLPLLPLTKGGATRAIIHRMFSELEIVADPNITSIAYTLAAYELKRSNEEELSWLERTYTHMYDIITESPFYKSIIAKGVEQGTEKGRQQGLEQGRERGLKEGRKEGLKEGRKEGRKEGLKEGREQVIAALRQTVIDIVHERIPTIMSFAELQVATIDDPSQLRHLVVKLSTVPNAEQAIQAFSDPQQGQ